VNDTTSHPTHPWLRQVRVAYIPGGQPAPLAEQAMRGLLDAFRELGHVVQAAPDRDTDALLTTMPFGYVANWREALMFVGRRRFKLDHTPTALTLVEATPEQFEATLAHLRASLAKEPCDPADFAYPGLAPAAHEVLIEQGRRGGPIMALERLAQAQAKCLRIALVVGRERPLFAPHLDLAGANPRTDADDAPAFYRDMALRIATAVSTTEVTEHQVAGEPIAREVWAGLPTIEALRVAGRELNERRFFTRMLRIADLVQVPAVEHAISSQYSEGCFGTWDPTVSALIATITGSARPVDKGNITEDDLAVIVGVRPDGRGALVRHVEGKHNSPPSSEAVEMMGMDAALPRFPLPGQPGVSVPAARSKLHGHRGVSAYDPRYVEFAPLDEPYYHYLVSCATEAQAVGIRAAFARSQALRDPADPRQAAFTVLPGHGVVIVEKWVAGKAPFQTIWEYMDAGYLTVANLIPQGPMAYERGPDGRMTLVDG